MTPAVSVIIPAYNYGHYLAGALESVLGQTTGDLEVFVIDDASTDDTPEVVRRYLGDARVHYERIDHAGVSAAKNTGIRLSQAPFVAFLDADDLWLLTKLERQLALFRADPDLGVAYTRRLLINEHGEELVYNQPTFYRGNVLEPLFRVNFVCQSSAMVRRPVFDAVGMFDERCPPVEDYDLWLRAALRYRFDYVDEPLVKYRTGHASLSSRNAGKLLIALAVMDRFLNERGGRAVLSPAGVRRAYAETYFHLALARRPSSSWAALGFSLKALAASPVYLPAWKGLASLAVPEGGRRWLRRALGRPADWSVPAPVVPGERGASAPC
jgi:glycosyltransferase involved in cell wall biosynthesis